MRRIALAAVLLAACRAAAVNPAPASATPPAAVAGAAPRGALVILGGGPRPDDVMSRFVALAGGPGRAEIVVLPMASGEGAEAGEQQAERFRRMGARARSMQLVRADADADSTAEILSRATGVWFGGGDQSRLTGVLLGTRAARIIRDRYVQGAVVGGTSAGAAVMTTPMITGDERRRGGDRYPSDSSDTFLTIARGNVVTAEGFGLLPGAIVDQHFFRRKRHNRLVSLVLEHPTMIGVGIDEGTAVVVRPDGRWEVVGQSAAVVYDARTASVTPPSARVLGAAGVRMHVLGPGSVYDPRTGRVEVLGGDGSP